MLIGFDASRAFKVDKTGTENYSYQLLKSLVKIDEKNNYMVYVRPSIITSTIVEDIVKGHINIHFKEINWTRFWTQGGLAFQTFKDKLDVLFIPAHTLPIIRRPNLKIVITVHDLGSEYLPQMHQLKQRLYLSLMQRFQLNCATKLIAVSKATKEDLIKRVGSDPKKIEVIYEGYDKKLFKPIKDDILVNSLRQYELVPQGYFLFVGTVQPRKNLERLIRAFVIYSSNEVRSNHKNYNSFRGRFSLRSNNNQAQLVIAGSKGWFSDELYKLPKKLGIENQVKFLGYVPDKDLPALYSGAIALLFPSLFEGFGLPILEAQACGCPVLTSNNSSMPEIASSTLSRLRGVKKGAILVGPYNIEQIAHAMIEIMYKKTRENLIKTGFENVKRFSWEKCARETLKVLESV